VSTADASTRSLADSVGPGWGDALAPVADVLAQLGDFLRAERAANRPFLPPAARILAALQQPLDDVRVLIVGQDPYPTPGDPVGLSFSVPAGRPLPRSLANIARELRDDTGETLSSGDLTPWQEQGVMLLNRVLTVRPGSPGSHRGLGWEQATEHAIRALAVRGGPLVAILWGRDARGLAPILADVPAIESPHPSPLSASSGFFGSRPFSRANALLAAQGAAPISWGVTEAPS